MRLHLGAMTINYYAIHPSSLQTHIPGFIEQLKQNIQGLLITLIVFQAKYMVLEKHSPQHFFKTKTLFHQVLLIMIIHRSQWKRNLDKFPELS